ncbi:MAG: hypothetical protein WA830_20065 [Candidatus Sulfotelmatobacter sp.]
MKHIRIFLLLPLLPTIVTPVAKGATQAQSSPPSLALAVDREISSVEKQILEAAEAMPAEKFNFSPETLNIPGDDYKGVRSFAVQVKHIASSNYFIWSPLIGDPVPASIKDGNGPADVKTKADILKFLRDSFSLGHKAAATLTPQNMLEPPAGVNPPACTWPNSPWRRPTTIMDRWSNISA